MCNCTKQNQANRPRWALVTSSGTQTFGSRLEADAARAANGGQGTIQRL